MTIKDHTSTDPLGVTARLVAELEQLFKPKPYTHETSHAHIMYLEGQQSIIRYMKQSMVGR